jgi:hypothetical protein
LSMLAPLLNLFTSIFNIPNQYWGNK